MENDTTEIVVPRNTSDTIAQLLIKEAVKGIFAITVTTIGVVVAKRLSKRNGPIEVIIVNPETTEEK